MSVPGLAVDTDLRWMIVARLAGAGHDSGARIDAQLAADDTDFGRRRAAACRAARPDPGAKEDAWSQVVDGRDVPLQMLQSLMAGFAVGPFGVGGLIQWGTVQADLLRPYVKRWADAVVAFWETRSREEAELFTELLYPRQLIEPETLEVAQSVLASIEGSSLPEFDQARRLADDRRVQGRDRALPPGPRLRFSRGPARLSSPRTAFPAPLCGPSPCADQPEPGTPRTRRAARPGSPGS